MGMSDLISRQDAINGLYNINPSEDMLFVDAIVDMLENLPEKSERKKGKWMMHSDYPDRLICSECTGQFDVWHWESKQMHICPNCGADMRGE